MPIIDWIKFFRLFPAVVGGVSLMAGIAVHERLATSPVMWGLLALSAFVLMVWCHLRNRVRQMIAAACAVLLLAGVSLAQMSHFAFASNDISRFVTFTPRLAFVRLYLPHEPVIRSHTFGDRMAAKPRQVTLARVNQMLTTAGWIDVQGEVLVQIQEPVEDLRAGQSVEVLGFLQMPGEAANPGQFDWQAYYRRDRIVGSLIVRERDQLRIIQRDRPPWLTSLRSQVRVWLTAGFDEEDKLDQTLLQMLLLGDYDPELRDIRDQFRSTGTGHHLAISGMHVAVAGGFVLMMLRLAGVSMRTSWVAATVFVVLYGIVALPSASVLRSVLLFVIASTALLSRRSTLAVQLLFVAGGLLLCAHPLDLFDAGFQLSFGTVLALMLLVTPVVRGLLNQREPKLIASEVALLPDMVRAGRWMDEKVLTIAAAGVVAWLASMPIVGIHFSQLNPWQVPASILLAPMVALAIVMGIVKVVLSAVCPPVAPVLAEMAAWCTWSMRASAEQLARLPAADVPLPEPAAWVAILCWASMVAAVVNWPLVSLRWAARLSVPVCFGLMLIGPYAGLSSASAQKRDDVLRITILSVGAGQVALVQTPASRTSSGSTTLIDAGSASLVDLFSNAIQPVLRDAGVTRVDRLFISHSNTDHFSAAAEVVDAYGVREVVVPASFDRDSSPEAKRMMRSLIALDTPPRQANAGDVIPLGSQTTLTVLWPGNDAHAIANANDRSLVLRLEHAGASVLFPGDIQDVALSRLAEVDQTNAIRSIVLVAPHHGSLEKSTEAFIRRVSPGYIVSSNDRTPSNKQKQFDVLARQLNIPLFRTHSGGAVVIEIDASGTVSVRPFLK